MIEGKPRHKGKDDARIERLVQTRTLELSDLASHLNKAREAERRNLARELHDELGSLLTAAKLDIAFIRAKCAQTIPELVPKCDRIAALLDQGAALKRRLIDRLHPSTLDLLGLGSAVRELVENFAAESKIRASAELDKEINPSIDDALTIYRILQEALCNTRKHAQASSVRISIEHAADELRISVRDDGKGFDPHAATKPAGHGLAAVRQWVHSLGGEFSIDSAPGSGTALLVRLPFRGR